VIDVRAGFIEIVSQQAITIRLMLRQRGRELEVGRGVLPFGKIVAARGDGDFNVTVVNRVPL
jgi:hypothetical protein